MHKKFQAVLSRWPAGVSAGPFLFYGGQMGLNARGAACQSFDEVAGAGANSTYDWVNRLEAPVGAQGIAIYEHYRKILKNQDITYSNLLRYHIFQRDKHFFSVFDNVRRTYENAPPASTAVGVGRFEPDDSVRLCIDSIVLSHAGETTLGPRTVQPGASAYAAAAHFSHVIQTGPYRFLAGQIPVDTSKPGSPLIRGYDDIPEQGRFLKVGRSHEDTRNGPIASQTWFTYDLIRQHLEAAGSAMDQILNVTVYLQDMRDFGTFHRVHERFFPANPPALTVIDVGEVGHKGTLIEIEPTAIAPDQGIAKRVIPQAKKNAQMSTAAEAGGLAFFSNVPGVGADGAAARQRSDLPAAWRKRVSGTKAGEIVVQAAAVIAQLEDQLKAFGKNLSRVTHLTLYLNSVDDFLACAPLFEKAFGKKRPALMILEVPHPSPVMGVRVSATAIAWVGDGEPVAITDQGKVHERQ
jgi:enamine deaminase RidA (YjgF/YER057c/UK114 family)